MKVLIITLIMLTAISAYSQDQNGDVNCDEAINILDVIYLINDLYKGGPEPCMLTYPTFWLVSDSVLYTSKYWGIARGGADNTLSHWSQVNLGVSSNTLGSYATVAGGLQDTVIGSCSVVAGGINNSAKGNFTVVCGGQSNKLNGRNSFMGAGGENNIDAEFAVIMGGYQNEVTAEQGVVCGGRDNDVSGLSSFVGTGFDNDIESKYSFIGGGWRNTILSSANFSYLFGINSNLSEDSTFMVDMPHIRFGDETDGYEFPETDGEAGQVLLTDGNCQLSWVTMPGIAYSYVEVFDFYLNGLYNNIISVSIDCPTEGYIKLEYSFISHNGFYIGLSEYPDQDEISMTETSYTTGGQSATSWNKILPISAGQHTYYLNLNSSSTGSWVAINNINFSATYFPVSYGSK